MFLLLFRERQHCVLASDVTALEEFRQLLRNPQMTRVMWLSFLIIGATNGFNAWFEKILNGNGFSPTDAGSIIGFALAVSVVGAALIPAISGSIGVRRPFIMLAALFGSTLTYPFLTTESFQAALGFAGAAGLLQLPSYILLVAMSVEISGQSRAGLANSLVMISNRLGAIIIITAVIKTAKSARRRHLQGV